MLIPIEVMGVTSVRQAKMRIVRTNQSTEDEEEYLSRSLSPFKIFDSLSVHRLELLVKLVRPRTRENALPGRSFERFGTARARSLPASNPLRRFCRP